MGQRLNDQEMALQRDEIADSEKGRPDEAKGAPRRLTLPRTKDREINAVAQHAHALRSGTKSLQPALQPVRNCDEPCRLSGSPLNPSARDGVSRDHIEIGASRRDDYRSFEGATE